MLGLISNSKRWIVSIVIVLLGLLSLISLFSQSDHYYGYTSKEENEPKCIISDGTGYYAYLPQYIIYPDQPRFKFIYSLLDKDTEAKMFQGLGRHEADSSFTNKYYPGTALLQAPFFSIAHAYYLNTNRALATGYTIGYRVSIQIAALFYWLIGVIALFVLFKRHNFSSWSILLCLMLITFGSNLNYYISFYPSYSHVYSFSLISLFLLSADSWVRHNKTKHLLLISIFIGLIFIVRPVNVTVVFFIPFLFSSWSAFMTRLGEFLVNYKRLALSFIMFLIPIGVFLAIRYNQTGTFSIFSYGEEGFTYALNPQFWNVLFSFEKGFFIYAPGLLLILIGIPKLYKNSTPFFFWGWVFNVVLILYIMSAWWCWTYGGGLGMRPMIDFFPILIIPMLYLFQYGTKWVKSLFIIIGLVGIVFYQTYQKQYNLSILPYEGISKELYSKIFFSTDLRFKWVGEYLKQEEHIPYGRTTNKQQLKFKYQDLQWLNESAQSDGIQIIELNNNNILTIDPTKLLTSDTLIGSLSGQVKLESPDINPFLVIKYYKDSLNIVEETIFPFGYKLDITDDFDNFEIEIYHPLTNKDITRIEFHILNGGGAPIFKPFYLKILDN